MLLWEQTVEILRQSMLAYAHVCNGNLACGILVVTFLARVALLPLGVRLSRMALAQQRAMQKIQPELDALRRRYPRDPKRLAEETRRVFAREGVSPVSASGCLGTLAQIPVFVALYSAVRQAATLGGRFFWVFDISRPDVFVTAIATLLTVAAAASGPSAPAPNRAIILVLSAGVTAVAVSKMAAGVGLYWGLSSLFGAVQGLVVQRRSAAAA